MRRVKAGQTCSARSTLSGMRMSGGASGAEVSGELPGAGAAWSMRFGMKRIRDQ